MSILKEALETVEGRDENYGDPSTMWQQISDLWSAYLGVRITAQDAVLMIDLIKTARLKINPKHHDSIVDKAGYAEVYHRTLR